MKMITLEAEKAQQIEESLDELYAELAADSHRDGPRCLMLTTAEKALSTIRAARAQADHIADADKMVREPVATLHDDGCFTWKSDEFRLLYDRQRAGWRMDVYAAPVEPAKQEPIELLGVKEAIEEGDGFWRPCSGCYESNEGAPPKGAPFSKVFQCYLGNGCDECGGLGAIWDNYDYEDVVVVESAQNNFCDTKAPPTISVRTIVDSNGFYSIEVVISGFDSLSQAEFATQYVQKALCGDEIKAQ